MTHTYVFVDVETTGFSPQRDRMIEVAAVVWRDSEIIEEYSSLLNPGRDIPEGITQLTGITNEMVADAPTINKIRMRLNRLLSDHVVVGHNVGFDMGFLREEGIGLGNHRLDTVTLASIVFPRFGRYGLQSLVKRLNLPETEAHRALADTLNTLHLFVEVWNHALDADVSLLEEIVAAGSRMAWPENIFFKEVLQMRIQNAFTDGAAPSKRRGQLFKPDKLDGTTLVPPEEDEPTAPIDVDMVKGMLQQGSNFSKVFPNFEPRAQQIEMIGAVANALNKQQKLMVEAGTGTGKSLAYLLPAAFWSTQNERRVVISTNTINLQDQLVNKDIPALQKTLPFDVKVAIRKGKSNYLCARLFRQMRHRGPKDREEMALFARILLWLATSKTGDVGEISLRTPGERMAWRRLSGENAPCTRQECSSERCPLHYARRRAELAHIVIVNHALLLSDVANQNHILPEFKDLIVDEAHHLEAAVTSGLSFSADKRFLDAVLDEVTQPKQGAVGQLQNSIKELPQHAQDVFDGLIEKLRAGGNSADIRLEEFFEVLKFFIQDFLTGRSDFAQQVRLVPRIRDNRGFDEVRLAWDNLHKSLATVIKGLESMADALAQLREAEFDIPDIDEVQASLAASASDMDEMRQNIDNIIEKPSPDNITWIEVFKDRMSLHAAPLHVGPLVEEHIFDKLDTVVMTSATMRTAPQGRYAAANFDYIRARLNAHEMEEMSVGSPFDYKASTLLYLCSDIPEPKQPGYQRYVEDAIVDVAKTLGGRTMVLFTSYKQLRDTASSIQGRLQEEEIQTLAQGQGQSRQILTDQFKEPNARAVLLGTKSFWEGVDVPGHALEAVLLVKLPFDVPSDPIIGARSETFENAFLDYQIPEAVLRFRQGFGRLIRRKSDEGIVVVLDKRVLTKRYGELFLNALPECTMLRQRTGRLPEIIKRWQKRDRKKKE